MIKFDKLNDYIDRNTKIDKAIISFFATNTFYSMDGNPQNCRIGGMNDYGLEAVKILEPLTKSWEESTVSWTSPWSQDGAEDAFNWLLGNGPKK